jgi:hypothetical protein
MKKSLPLSLKEVMSDRREKARVRGLTAERLETLPTTDWAAYMP